MRLVPVWPYQTASTTTGLCAAATRSRCGRVHWVNRPLNWVGRERLRGSTVLGVELAEDAVSLGDLKPATKRTIILLGHEHNGIPDDAWPLLDQVVEIPMVGVGHSLNVAVAGSLILYKLAGLS